MYTHNIWRHLSTHPTRLSVSL